MINERHGPRWAGACADLAHGWSGDEDWPFARYEASAADETTA